jgi:DNA repair protein RecN (Recombination protein N)
MLTLLKIRNVALIDDLTIEFGDGLNLLTGETGSGKSIIVDSLAALTGDRVSSEIVKQGEDVARIEGLFRLDNKATASVVDAAGIDTEMDELIIRREVSRTGRNRVFVNDQLVTQGLLKQLGSLLADIHGQGEQAALYDVASHIAMLDSFAGVDKESSAVFDAYRGWSALKDELTALEKDESEKLQLVDILKFQVDEIVRADLRPGEDVELEDEKRRLNNVEKLSALSSEAHSLLYDDEQSALATLERAARVVNELAEYDERFRGFDEGLNSARAVAEELGRAARDFGASLEFSPNRLNGIEERLSEVSRLKRKYGETIDAVLEHLRVSEERLNNIETAGFREQELGKQLTAASQKYLDAAHELHEKRVAAAAKFSKQVEQDLKAVALEKAKFDARIDVVDTFSPNGIDRVEFFFSANPGEPLRPLAKVASGGEASRLMLILKTASRSRDAGKSAVFDEIDIGIGGRVAEAVGRKLKSLAATQQVFCVTHQPQIASLADRHFVVEKVIVRGKTTIAVRELDAAEKIEELARMLAGEQVTDQARENARAMLAASN